MLFKDKFIGASSSFRHVLAQADKMAGSAARVLIAGETGTGKELVAQYLHAGSPRAGKPFIAINCAALPENLLESELFGHAKGAFTAAHRTHEGLAAAANGGTLFLDEIAEMPLALQAKLLRFLETGEFRKVGATQVERVDVRVIAATHQDLAARVAQGHFREDLYYRLSVLVLQLPPLRARKEDIPLLAAHFLGRFAAQEKKGFASFTPPALERLVNYAWPGNIRELQNTVQKIAVLHDGAAVTREMVEDVLPHLAPAAENVVRLGDAPKPLWQVEKEAIEAAVQYCRGNIPRAAALLQVSPSTLYRRREGAE